MTNLPFLPNPSQRVLVASSSPVVRQRLLESLRSSARRVEQASGGAEALGHLENGPWQVLYLDRALSDLNAEELSQTIQQRFPDVEVVLLDGEKGSDLASQDKLDSIPASARSLPVPDTPLASSPERHAPLPGMIGQSRSMQPVYRGARLLARRDTTVLLTGPTGSGKELVARGIHALSRRAARAFVVVNCAAIPEALLESELFGYMRGAFTGAMQSYAGRIQTAHGGTLFLDEIGEMPLSLQPKLLRFMEQKELQRLGSSETVRVDARVIAATNANLQSLIRQGKFREDLYYRLCTFPMEIPPLRERMEDIAELAQHFLEKFSIRPPVPELSAEGERLLKAYPWAGNVRELQNVIERALILAEDAELIGPEHLLMSAGNVHELK
ncbi:MAG TPA: sigma-54 dependent transcriptional regulator [Terriglobales bacterium]|nr:sigma-54 dependent transcriptional regulator [Terriglobales bacterium]